MSSSLQTTLNLMKNTVSKHYYSVEKIIRVLINELPRCEHRFVVSNISAIIKKSKPWFGLNRTSDFNYSILKAVDNASEMKSDTTFELWNYRKFSFMGVSLKLNLDHIPDVGIVDVWKT